MKKLVIIFLFFTYCSYGQRHIGGTLGLDLSCGFLDNFKFSKGDDSGFYGSVSLSKFMLNGGYWKYGYDYTLRYFNPDPNIASINVKQFLVNVNYFKDILSNRGSDVYLNLGAGLDAGYESINNGSRKVRNGVFINQRSRFLFGLGVVLDVELYFFDGFALLLKASERYHPLSDLSKFNFQAGAGLRFIIVTR